MSICNRENNSFYSPAEYKKPRIKQNHSHDGNISSFESTLLMDTNKTRELYFAPQATDNNNDKIYL